VEGDAWDLAVEARFEGACGVGVDPDAHGPRQGGLADGPVEGVWAQEGDARRGLEGGGQGEGQPWGAPRLEDEV
jgi:hypothetical protein